MKDKAHNVIVSIVTGRQVILNWGTNDGYQKGMKFLVECVVKQVKDPNSGQVLRTLKQPIGEITLIEVDSRPVVGVINSGAPMKVGDIAKPLP